MPANNAPRIRTAPPPSNAVYAGLHPATKLLLLALAEAHGHGPQLDRYVFLLVTVSLYACIGVVCRTSDQVR